MPGGLGETSTRYVLGLVGLDQSAVASAHVTHASGQWSVDVTLTDWGSARWDELAADQFHAIIGAVVNGRVVSAPIAKPT